MTRKKEIKEVDGDCTLMNEEVQTANMNLMEISNVKETKNQYLPLLECSPRIIKNIEDTENKDDELMVEQINDLVIYDNTEDADIPLPSISRHATPPDNSSSSSLIILPPPMLNKTPNMKSIAKKVMEKNRTDLCRDMTGKYHVIKQIRDRRHKAVMRGMTWLNKFLNAKNNAALYAIGDDAPRYLIVTSLCKITSHVYIHHYNTTYFIFFSFHPHSVFFEIWYTSADSRIRCKAKGIAEKLIEKYEKSLLKGNQSCGDSGIDLFFEIMFLLRCKHEMELDTNALLKLADKIYKCEKLNNTDILFGVRSDSLKESVSVADWLMLLMKVMCMEYNNLLHRKRWPISWGLKACFIALRDVPLQPPPIDDVGGPNTIVYIYTLAYSLCFTLYITLLWSLNLSINCVYTN